MTTLAKHRLTRPLFLRVVNQMAPGTYASELARVKAIDEITLREADAGLDELLIVSPQAFALFPRRTISSHIGWWSRGEGTR